MNINKGKKSYKEMKNQNKAWESVLESKESYKKIVNELKSKSIEKIIFVGCGSSYYIGLSGAFVLREYTNVDVQAIPASELMFFPDNYINNEKKTAIFAISRSGETKELIKALENINYKENVVKVAITCNNSSSLARISDFIFLSDKGKEESVVMTKSFTSMLLIIQFIAGLWSENISYIEELYELPALFENNIGKIESEINDYMLEVYSKFKFNKFEFLGQGNFYGIANEAMLKMKEMTIVPSEDFHSLEFRHGPKSIVDSNMLITMYVGSKTYEKEIKLAKELADYGGNLLLIGRSSELKDLDNYNNIKVIEIDTSLSQLSLNLFYLIPSQLLAFYIALDKNINVDEPRNLTQVVEEI